MKKKAAALNGPRPIVVNSNSKNYKSKLWGSGASYTLTHKADMTLWVKAFLIRYYEHLAVSHEHKDNVLVYWQNAKGQEPVETDRIFDFTHPENSLLT